MLDDLLISLDLHARAADSNCRVSHFPLVLISWQRILCVRGPICRTVHCMMVQLLPSLDSPELPSSGLLGKIEKTVSEFTLPPPHHVQPSPSYKLPAIKTQFKFVREDTIVNLLLLLFIRVNTLQWNYDLWFSVDSCYTSDKRFSVSLPIYLLNLFVYMPLIRLNGRDVKVLIFLDFSFRYDSVHQKY